MIPAQYIPVLQKFASYGDPDYDVDSRERADEEVQQNRKDNKTTLTGLFRNAGDVEKHQTKTINKVLPEKGKMERETANPLLKVAMQPPHYRAVMHLALKDELENISASI